MLRILYAAALFVFTAANFALADNAADAPPLLLNSDQGVFAEPKAVPATPVAPKDIPSATSASITTSGATNGTANQSIWIGPGIAIYDGNYGNILGPKTNVALTMNVSWMARATPSLPFYVGIDGALYFWNSLSEEGRSIAGTGIQALPTAIYQFTLPTRLIIHPYLGLSFGPHIYVGQNQAQGGASTQAAFLEFLVRPGVQWELNSGFSLNFEPKFGVLNADFVCIPQLTASLAI
jgi:hypothetical protein